MCVLGRRYNPLAFECSGRPNCIELFFQMLFELSKHTIELFALSQFKD